MENNRSYYLYYTLGLIILALLFIIFLIWNGFFEEVTDKPNNVSNLERGIVEQTNFYFLSQKNSDVVIDHNRQFSSHFGIVGSSDEYKEVTNISSLYEKVISGGSEGELANISLYLEKLLNFGLNNKNDTKERAYALNVFNVLYLQGSYQDPFIASLQNHPSFLKKYNSHLNYVRSLKKGVPRVSGIMFNYGAAEKNYAVQMTMADINQYSYELYPHIYPLLRQSLNLNQARAILRLNYALEENYDLVTFAQSKYYDGYIEYFDPKIEQIKKEGRFFEDLSFSAYEPLIMYSEYLWIKYRREKDDEKKRQTLSVIRSLTYELVRYSDVFNKNMTLFYGYVMSATNKVRLAQEKVYESKENEKLLLEAEEVMLWIINNNKSKQMDYWLKNIPKELSVYKAMEVLSARNPKIREYWVQVRK